MKVVTIITALIIGVGACCTGTSAQTDAAQNHAGSDADANGTTYATLYLTNVTQEQKARDVVSDIRSMLPRTMIFYVQEQNAISIRGSADDLALARKMIADLDKARKAYRLTYTITETENGKRIGAQSYSLVIAPGENTTLKEGSRVPILTGESGNTGAGAQVQYLDIGLNIEASLDSCSDGVRLRTKVEQSSLAEAKSSGAAQDPVIRQTLLQGTMTMAQGKPIVLGSVDISDSTRRQEIQIVPEVIP